MGVFFVHLVEVNFLLIFLLANLDGRPVFTEGFRVADGRLLALKTKKSLPDLVSNCVLFLNSHNNYYYFL